MKISKENIALTCPEAEIYESLLSMDGKHILELGCGNAEITGNIATSGVDRKITALEVDKLAHEKNLAITHLPNVAFHLAGAEDIPLDDASVDFVLMFKSLHHVPMDLMAQSMQEIRRVLKPAGLVYISEPVYAGAFNEILRLFHDEKEVREAAFHTVSEVVNEGLFKLVEQTFFNSPMKFESYADFEEKVIGATHTSHTLDESLYKNVQNQFEKHVGKDGAHFLMPIRVDLLQRPD